MRATRHPAMQCYCDSSVKIVQYVVGAGPEMGK
jgi:hypothetical protein